MRRVYTCVVDESVLRLFTSCRTGDRDELLRIFSRLGDNPFQKGDYTQKTASLREVQVKRFGKWFVTFWPDHGECELRIVEVKRLVT